MSSTIVLAVRPGVGTHALEELRNSWGSAPYVWDSLCRRYLGAGWFERGRDKAWLQQLWDAYQRQDIPQAERAVLMFTFDRAYCLREHFRRMAAAIREFMVRYPPDPSCVNHWPRIAAILDERSGDGTVPAIGLHCTTVSPNPFAGEWDEENDIEKPFDWRRAQDLWTYLDAEALP